MFFNICEVRMMIVFAFYQFPKMSSQEHPHKAPMIGIGGS